MSFECTFYNVADDNKVLTKTLGTATHTCASTVPYNPLSPLTGKLILDYHEDILTSNYVNFLGKYHFITDKQLLSGQKIEVTCKVDVLQTYNTDIKETRVYCKRTANGKQQAQYLYDSSAPISEKKFVAYSEEGSNICARSADLILLTVG